MGDNKNTLKFGVLNRLYRYLRRAKKQEAQLIYFKKIARAPKIISTRRDIELEKHRRSLLIGEMKKQDIMKNQAVRDLVYFLTVECRSLAGDFKKVCRVLDLGCGTGGYSMVFRNSKIFSSGFEYAGTEIDESFVKLCKRAFPKELFYRALADRLPFDDSYFDIIFSIGTLQYTFATWKKSLEEMHRVSKKYAVINRIPLARFADTFNVQQDVVIGSNAEKHFFIVLNRMEFERYLDKVGFSIVCKDYSSEEYSITGVDEKIMLAQYLLKKKNNG